MTQPISAQDEAPKKAVKDDDSVGYFLGYTIGRQLAEQGFANGDFTLKGLQSGVSDALAGNAPGLSDEQLQATDGKIRALLQKRQEAVQAEMKKLAVMNEEKSEVWMKQNASAEGVKDLGQGIQYKVITEGEGGSPTAADTVSVHYTGKFINGEVFDSSVQRGEPATFPVGNVIVGWQLALQKMKVGSKWMLYIPADKAYGESGKGSIGPNEALVFEVELLEIL
jgi:FKBP-type peptidyl-prolyl cis-trans isomerase FklB